MDDFLSQKRVFFRRAPSARGENPCFWLSRAFRLSMRVSLRFCSLMRCRGCDCLCVFAVWCVAEDAMRLSLRFYSLVRCRECDAMRLSLRFCILSFVSEKYELPAASCLWFPTKIHLSPPTPSTQEKPASFTRPRGAKILRI